jgi:protein-S-isoprenylcysteine O-methyltransferase Ste14
MWAARGVKQTERQESRASRLTYHVPLIAGGVLLAFPNILGTALEGAFVPHGAFWRWLGTLMVATGLGFAVLARVWLAGNWSATVTVKQAHELIRSGPYALVRHPIYTGMLFALAGTAVWLGNWRALIGFALIAGAFVHKLRIEEKFMAEQFGDDYARYRAQVAALIPFLV